MPSFSEIKAPILDNQCQKVVQKIGVVGSFTQPQQKWGVFTPNQK